MPEDTIAAVERDVAAGAATSVSAYLSGLAAQATRDSGLLALLDELDATTGAPSDEDSAWAHRLLDHTQ